MSNKKEANVNRSDCMVHDPDACNLYPMEEYLTNEMPVLVIKYFKGRQ